MLPAGWGDLATGERRVVDAAGPPKPAAEADLQTIAGATPCEAEVLARTEPKAVTDGGLMPPGADGPLAAAGADGPAQLPADRGTSPAVPEWANGMPGGCEPDQASLLGYLFGGC